MMSSRIFMNIRYTITGGRRYLSIAPFRKIVKYIRKRKITDFSTI